MLFALNPGAVATPLALVITVTDVAPPGNVPLAPLGGAVKVTLTPCNKLLLESTTVACSTSGNVEPEGVLCGVPPVAEILLGIARLVRSYNIGKTNGSPILALAAKEPPMLFAVSGGATASPFASVIAKPVFDPPNEALAPELGKLNATVTPLIGEPDSVTIARKDWPKAVLARVDC